MSWTGVELEGGPAPPTPENVAAVMEIYPVGERFFQEFTLRQVLLNAAKNGFGPSAAGTSSRAEGPNTAGPAATTACPAPTAPGADGEGCPYREARPLTLPSIISTRIRRFRLCMPRYRRCETRTLSEW